MTPHPYQYPPPREYFALVGDLVQPLLVRLIALDPDGSPQAAAFLAFDAYTPPREGEQINYSDGTPLGSFSGRVMEVTWNFSAGAGAGRPTVDVFVLPDVD